MLSMLYSVNTINDDLAASAAKFDSPKHFDKLKSNVCYLALKQINLAEPLPTKQITTIGIQVQQLSVV